MNPNDTERLARWLGFNPLLSKDGTYVTINPGWPCRENWWPHKSLDDVALAWEVLAERGLMKRYTEALLPLIVKTEWDGVRVGYEDYYPHHILVVERTTTPAQHAAALLAVCDAQGGE